MSNLNRFLACLVVLFTGLLLVRELQFQEQERGKVATVTVFVTGEVQAPGPIQLPDGARRMHAFAACGGPTDNGDLAASDPAKKLTDGETVVLPAIIKESVAVPESTAQAPEQPRPSESPKKININRAGTAELELLPGIGPVLAGRIVSYREEKAGGSFASLEDLAAIRGIRGKTVARIKPYLELEAHD